MAEEKKMALEEVNEYMKQKCGFVPRKSRMKLVCPDFFQAMSADWKECGRQVEK